MPNIFSSIYILSDWPNIVGDPCCTQVICTHTVWVKGQGSVQSGGSVVHLRLEVASFLLHFCACDDVPGKKWLKEIKWVWLSSGKTSGVGWSFRRWRQNLLHPQHWKREKKWETWMYFLFWFRLITVDVYRSTTGTCRYVLREKSLISRCFVPGFINTVI